MHNSATEWRQSTVKATIYRETIPQYSPAFILCHFFRRKKFIFNENESGKRRHFVSTFTSLFICDFLINLWFLIFFDDIYMMIHFGKLPVVEVFSWYFVFQMSLSNAYSGSYLWVLNDINPQHYNTSKRAIIKIKGFDDYVVLLLFTLSGGSSMIIMWFFVFHHCSACRPLHCPVTVWIP